MGSFIHSFVHLFGLLCALMHSEPHTFLRAQRTERFLNHLRCTLAPGLGVGGWDPKKLSQLYSRAQSKTLRMRSYAKQVYYAPSCTANRTLFFARSGLKGSSVIWGVPLPPAHPPRKSGRETRHGPENGRGPCVTAGHSCYIQPMVAQAGVKSALAIFSDNPFDDCLDSQMYAWYASLAHLPKRFKRSALRYADQSALAPPKRSEWEPRRPSIPSAAADRRMSSWTASLDTGWPFWNLHKGSEASSPVRYRSGCWRKRLCAAWTGHRGGAPERKWLRLDPRLRGSVLLPRIQSTTSSARCKSLTLQRRPPALSWTSSPRRWRAAGIWSKGRYSDAFRRKKYPVHTENHRTGPSWSSWAVSSWWIHSSILGVTGARRVGVPYLLRSPAITRATRGLPSIGSSRPMARWADRIAARRVFSVPGARPPFREQWSRNWITRSSSFLGSAPVITQSVCLLRQYSFHHRNCPR